MRTQYLPDEVISMLKQQTVNTCVLVLPPCTNSALGSPPLCRKNANEIRGAADSVLTASATDGMRCFFACMRNRQSRLNMQLGSKVGD